MSTTVLRGGDKKEDAEKVLKTRPLLVLFFMDGCPACIANKPAWEDAKKKAGVQTAEIESSAVPDSEGITGFPTMKMIDKSGKEKETTGTKESGDDIIKELDVPKKKGGRRTRHRKLRSRRRTIRSYLKF
jgi:hypothetical protein